MPDSDEPNNSGPYTVYTVCYILVATTSTQWRDLWRQTDCAALFLWTLDYLRVLNQCRLYPWCSILVSLQTHTALVICLMMFWESSVKSRPHWRRSRSRLTLSPAPCWRQKSRRRRQIDFDAVTPVWTSHYIVQRGTSRSALQMQSDKFRCVYRPLISADPPRLLYGSTRTTCCWWCCDDVWETARWQRDLREAPAPRRVSLQPA